MIKLPGLLKQLVFRSQVNRRASILVISLWSLLLLASFAVSLGYGVRQKLILIQRLDERGKLHFIAEAGVKKAISEMQKHLGEEIEEGGYDSLNESWSSNIAMFKDIQVGGGSFNIYHDYMNRETGLLETGYGLIDEERKININKLNKIILKRLFQAVLDFDVVEAQELAASIVDWRDTDSQLSIAIGSAEDQDYEGLHYPYEAKDGPFEVLEELLLVRGMSRDIFLKLKDFITIYGDGMVNINTASREVFIALGLKEEIVDKIIDFRRGDDDIIGTPYDNVFYRKASIVSDITNYYSLSDSEGAQFSNIVNTNLVTNSNNFTVKSIARLTNRKNTSQITCVFEKGGKILYWQEGH